MSNDTKWTPGPWRVGPVDDTVVTAPDGSEIAAIDGDYNEPDLWPVMEANARLIAAAPDLYAALESQMRATTLALQSAGHSAQDVADCTAQARAALCKARGEP